MKQILKSKYNCELCEQPYAYNLIIGLKVNNRRSILRTIETETPRLTNKHICGICWVQLKSIFEQNDKFCKNLEMKG